MNTIHRFFCDLPRARHPFALLLQPADVLLFAFGRLVVALPVQIPTPLLFSLPLLFLLLLLLLVLLRHHELGQQEEDDQHEEVFYEDKQILVS